MALHITGEAASDAVLDEHPFALLAGMMLDQQFPMERAFAGPAKVLERFGSLDPEAIAAADPEEFAALCAEPPAVHRFPGSMAARLQALAALPGFGKQKSQIFVALLAKQLGVRPPGWEDAAGAYAEAGSYRSVADVVDAQSLERVRAFKKDQKQQKSLTQ